MNWQEFFHMGGYALEVWTCWILTSLTLALFVIIYKRANAKIRAEIARDIRREQQFEKV